VNKEDTGASWSVHLNHWFRNARMHIIID
jgi:hypothetical protein